ncbi:MAG: NUDIX domain-containing protein [Tenuifilaceae bacterium]|jgi:8-oxo-dGTP pyrophosphatase MutT (NUDIX family)|nr:NUDIX domain-containing protein [Tenuifilaceae bacterium]
MAISHSIYFNNRRLVIAEQLSMDYSVHNDILMSYDGKNTVPKVLQFFKSSSQLFNVFVIASDVKACLKDFEQAFTLVDAAGGLVQNAKGEYLLIRRRGHWDLPKGKVEVDEPLDVAALREVTEECGIESIAITRHLIDTYHTYSINSIMHLKRTVWYLMQFSGNEPLVPQAEEDITQALWLPAQEIPALMSDSFGSVVDVFRAAGVV